MYDTYRVIFKYRGLTQHRSFFKTSMLSETSMHFSSYVKKDRCFDAHRCWKIDVNLPKRSREVNIDLFFYNIDVSLSIDLFFYVGRKLHRCPVPFLIRTKFLIGTKNPFLLWHMSFLCLFYSFRVVLYQKKTRYACHRHFSRKKIKNADDLTNIK